MIKKSRADLLSELDLVEKRAIELKSELISRGDMHSYDKIQGLVKVTVDQMVEGVQIIDKEWRYVYLNKAALAHARRSLDDLLGRTMMECYPGFEKTVFFEQISRAMKERETRSTENYFEYPDGSKCWYELFIEPHVHGLLIRSIDITKRKKIEESYFRSQKMEALGRLASGMAHDFSNKLNAMQIYLNLALDNLGENKSTLKKNLDDIFTAVNESSELVRHLLTYSRKQVFQMQTLNLNQHIQKLSSAFSKILGSQIAFKSDLNKSVGEVRLDPSQFDQVLVNLIFNARDSMIDGGELFIGTSLEMLDEEYCDMNKNLVPGMYACIRVTDSGVGMPPELVQHVFDPFYQTKNNAAGTGLGLATVYGIINQSNGHIEVESKEKLGTTFRIYLPQHKEI